MVCTHRNTDHFDHFDNVIKSKRMRCTGYVACVGNKTHVYRVRWENLNERDQRLKQRVRIVLK